MSHRVNVILSDTAWEALQDLPKGERSHFIEGALLKELGLRRRREAGRKMNALRDRMKPVSGCSEEWIREDRERY
jgi:hypothetical protein